MDWGNFVVRRRVPVVFATLGVTAITAFFAARITINTDIVSFLPQDSPSVHRFNELDRKFGGQHLAIVGLEAEDVFSPEVLGLIHQLTTAFQQVDGVSFVTSLTNVIDFRETEWGVEVTKLLPEGAIPRDPEELKKLKRYVLSRSLYRDRLVSSDGRVTLILVRIRGDADRVAVAHEMRQITRRVVADRYRTYFAGMPFEMEFMGRLILGDMWRLTPMAAALVLMVLFLSFRNLRGALFPFTTVVVSAIFTFGFMGATGLPLTLISAATPVLILAVGSAYGIHFLKKHHELMTSSANPNHTATKAVREIGVPIVLAAATTFIGFVSLLSSQLSIIREFGIATGLGILVAMVVTLTFLPAVLSWLPHDRPGRYSRPRSMGLSHWTDKLAHNLVRHPDRWLLGSALLVILLAAGIPRITREVNLSEYFKPNSEVRIAEALMQRRFGGSHPVQIVLEGDVKHPAVLQLMRKLERRLEAYPWFTHPESVADLICEMNRVMNNRYTVPETPEGVANLWFLLEGQEIMEQLVTGDTRSAQIQLRIRSLDTGVILRSVDFVDEVLNALPETLVVVDRNGLPEDLQPEIDHHLVGEAMQATRWELEKRGFQFADSQRVEALLLRHVVQMRRPEVEPELARAMASTAIAFLTSDESDIPLRGRRIQRELLRKLTEGLKAGRIRSPAEIQVILKSTVPGLSQEDPDLLTDTAEHLWYLMRERRLEVATDSLVKHLADVLPPEFLQRIDARRDIKAAVWPLNRSRVTLGPEEFRRLAGQAAIQPLDRVLIRVEQAGLGPVFRELDAKLLRSQLTSLGLALIIVLVLLCAQLRSVRLGLVGVSPLVITLTANFGLMGLAHIPLDDATLMTAPLAIGIGVDYAIHFTYRFRKELQKAADAESALRTTLSTTGVAILINALSVGLGFCVLLFGSVVPVQRFGLMVALAMVVSAGGALTTLPVLLLRFGGHERAEAATPTASNKLSRGEDG